MLNIDDPEFSSPLVINDTKAEATFDPDVILMITSMGFTEKQSKKALNGKSNYYYLYQRETTQSEITFTISNEIKLIRQCDYT